jgi:hypothetical protein
MIDSVPALVLLNTSISVLSRGLCLPWGSDCALKGRGFSRAVSPVRLMRLLAEGVVLGRASFARCREQFVWDGYSCPSLLVVMLVSRLVALKNGHSSLSLQRQVLLSDTS